MYSLIKHFSLAAALLICIAGFAKAQSATQYFSPLSTDVYTTKIAALKARKVPVKYTDKKEQSTYAGIIKDRDQSILSDFENNRIVHDTMLLNKCNRIVQKIKEANKNYSFDSISVFINRSSVANASCYGEGTLFVNLGLFLWIDNDDELALIIGHELSHQFLDHLESKIKKNITLMSSDDFINEMKAIKKSSDGKYERYKNLMKSLVTENGKHSRYKESEADSLGVVLARNAGYDVKSAATVLLKLDHVEDIFVSDKLYSVKAAFEKAVPDTFVFAKPRKYNGLSMVHVTMNADKDFDSVKTHPDCIVRYKQIMGTPATGQETSCCGKLNTPLKEIKERALVELIRYEYEAKNLTLCAHFCLFAMQNGFTGSFYDYYLSLCFSKIYEADRNLEKFTATNSDARAGSTLKELQDFIFNCNSPIIGKIALYFLDNSADPQSEDHAFAQAMYNAQVKTQDATTAQNSFKSKYPNSKYNYLFKPKNN